jgi:uncharacterized protein (TIGR02302 family)
MLSRLSSARHTLRTGVSGPQLTLAHCFVVAENILRVFAGPLVVTCVFIVLAWFGIFSLLFPWVHFVALAVFFVLFFATVGTAYPRWRPLSYAEAKRRVEEAGGLRHRPFDVLDDRPATLEPDQWLLWQIHVERARGQLKKLHWPRWKPVFSDHDHYAIRYALLILLVISGVFGWGTLGGRLIMALNPAIAKLQIVKPALDAWISPPAYTHLPPIMIATPAGLRRGDDIIDVPEGSTVTAHLAEKDGEEPILVANDKNLAFTTDVYGDFEASGIIQGGEDLTIRRGWRTLGSWHIRVIPDRAPQIAFVDQPSSTERKTVRLSYDAKDDYGITSVIARITPRESLPGMSSDPMDITLSTPESKEVKRVNFEDLTAHPWSGLPVQIQLIATDGAGHSSVSDAVDFTLPERVFFHPVARALIEERKKLLISPEDDSVRNEVANVMAGIAHQPANYRGDPVVLMALRSGAVRLVLDHAHDVIPATNDILWQTAVRIEDGTAGFAEQNVRQAQKELVDAFDRNASQQEIQKLIDRLHEALTQYLSELSARLTTRPGPVEDLSQILGPQSNVLTPQDLDHLVEQMQSLSASGNRQGAQQQLAQLQSLLENLRKAPTQLTPEQKQAVQDLRVLHEIVDQQKTLLDKTFQSAQSNDSRTTRKLSPEQTTLFQRVLSLMNSSEMKNDDNLTHASTSMRAAGSVLQQGLAQQAMHHQNDALKALQDAVQAMTEELRSNLMILPSPEMSAGDGGRDPFGQGFKGFLRDDGSVKVPDQMEVRKVREILDELQRRAGDMSRPKTERDYIDRLLQNF